MRYEDKHAAYIREIADSCHSYKELTELFNIRFGTEQSVCSLSQYASKVLKVRIASKKNAQQLSQEQRQWLVENYDDAQSYSELTSLFNARFNRDKPISAIREVCTKRLGLKGMPNPTQFSTDNRKEQCPVGTIRVNGNGTTYIKVKLLDKPIYMSGYEEPYWLPIQKKIWQDHYGEVPEGKMVIFLDGNRENLDISNLYCIDRKISAVMASNSWYTGSREHTLAAIKWCELYYAMKAQREAHHKHFEEGGNSHEEKQSHEISHRQC